MNTRNCPICNSIIEYTNIYRRNFAEKNKLMCNKCSQEKRKEARKLSGNAQKFDKQFVRQCPQCNCDIFHSNERNRDKLDSIKKLCRSCGIKKMANTKVGKPLSHLQSYYNRSPEKGPFKRNCPNCNKELEYSRKDKLAEANKLNSVCNSCSAKLYKKSWNYVIKDEHLKKMAATKAGYATFDEYMAELPARKKYYREVRRITLQQPVKDLPNYDKLGLCGVEGAYQIDHKISIDKGFHDKIDPSIIGHIDNLQIIPWKENLLKSNKD